MDLLQCPVKLLDQALSKASSIAQRRYLPEDFAHIHSRDTKGVMPMLGCTASAPHVPVPASLAGLPEDCLCAHTNTYFSQNQLLHTDLSATFKLTWVILTGTARKLSQIAQLQRREEQTPTDEGCLVAAERYISSISKGGYRDIPF